MNIELTEKQMDAIAVKTARKVINLLNRDEQPRLDKKKKYIMRLLYIKEMNLFVVIVHNP